jgi:hypothetical protein
MIDLIVCSICLRVRRWPHGAVCDACVEAISHRRASTQDAVAA